MSHSFPYRRPSERRPDPGPDPGPDPRPDPRPDPGPDPRPYGPADRRHASADQDFYGPARESLSRWCRAAPRPQDGALSILSSCGLEPADLALLAELPEHVLTVESLPDVLEQLKGKRTPSSSSSSSSYPRGSARRPPLHRYPLDRAAPGPVPLDRDRWGNPRTVGGSIRANPPPSSSSSSSSSSSCTPDFHHRPGPSEFGKTGRDVGTLLSQDFLYRPGAHGKTGGAPVSSQDRDSFGSAGKVSRTRTSRFSQPGSADHRSAPPDHRPAPPDHRSAPPDHRPAPPDHRSAPPDHRPAPPDHRSAPPDHRPAPPDHRPAPPDHLRPAGRREPHRTVRTSSRPASMPSKTEALDFHGTSPSVFPYSCSLCDITVMSEKVWIKHINGTQHADGQLSLLQRFPTWDCRMETVSRADDLSEKPKDERSAAWQLQPANQSAKQQTHRRTHKKTAVVCVKFPAQSVDETFLRKLIEPFGKIVKILMFPSLAFMELGSADQANDLVKYHANAPLTVGGGQVEFTISNTFSFLQSSRVVSFTPAPTGKDGQSDLIGIVKRFGSPLYTLMLPSKAFVEMKSDEDAQKLVDYFGSNTLRVNNRSIQVSFSGEYKSLMRISAAEKYQEETCSKKRSRSSSRENEGRSMRRRSSIDREEEKRSSRVRKTRSRSTSTEKYFKKRTTRSRSRSRDDSREKSSRQKRSRSREKYSQDRRTRTRSRTRSKSRERQRSRSKSWSRGNTAQTDSGSTADPDPAPVRDSRPEPVEKDQTEEEEEEEEEDQSSADDSDIEGMEVIGEDGQNLDHEDMETLDEEEEEKEEDEDEGAAERTDSPDGDQEKEVKNEEEEQQEEKVMVETKEEEEEEQQQEEKVMVETKEEEEQQEEKVMVETKEEEEEEEQQEEKVMVETKEEEEEVCVTKRQEEGSERTQTQPEDDEEEPDFPVDLENCITLDELEEDQCDAPDAAEERRRESPSESQSTRVVYFCNLPMKLSDADFCKLVEDFGTAVRYFRVYGNGKGFIEMSSSSEALRVVSELRRERPIVDGVRVITQISNKYRRLFKGWPVPGEDETKSARQTRSSSRRSDRQNQNESNRRSERRNSSRRTQEESASKKTRSKDSASRTSSRTSAGKESAGNKSRTTSRTTPESETTDKDTSQTESTPTQDTRPPSRATGRKSAETSERLSPEPSSDREPHEASENTCSSTADESASRQTEETKSSADEQSAEDSSPETRPENKTGDTDSVPEEQKLKEPETSGPGPEDPVSPNPPESTDDPQKPQTEQEPAADGLQDSQVPAGGAAAAELQPTKPVGTEFVRPVVGYFCNLCQLIYADEDEAKLQHCSSLAHYRKYQEQTGKDPWTS